MFIPNFSKTAKPLILDELKQDEKFVWTEALEEAFTQLRDLLCSDPLLQYPDLRKYSSYPPMRLLRDRWHS